MRKIYLVIMVHICWFIEDVHDLFCKDNSSFYPSCKYEWELEKLGK